MDADACRAAALIEKVKTEFPDRPWSTWRYVGHGWDHDVLVLDERVVIRAPKNDEYRTEFGHEIALMDYLSPLIGLRIPHYTLVAHDCSLAGHQMLVGEEMTQDVFAGLDEEKRGLLARELAEFLTVLHAIPLADLETYQIRMEDETALCNELVRRARTILYPRLRAEERAAIEEYTDRLRRVTEATYERVLVHCDLTADHILWDAATSNVSVIDFSDRAFGDPARDFAGLFEYGLDFVREVAGHYEGQTAGLLDRAELYYKRISIWLMIDAIEGFPCSFEDGYRMFRRVFCGCCEQTEQAANRDP